MYLIVSVTYEHKTVPLISLIMIAAVYGLQALVFVLRRKWDMVGWMVFYILAIPIFSFMLPIYSFWRMDDFSWGATRVVLGESGKKFIIHASAFRCKTNFVADPCCSRMRASLIPAPYLSRRGMTMYVNSSVLVRITDLYARKTSSGTENRTTALAHGCLPLSSATMATQNLALHLYMATKRITSHAANRPRHRNLVLFLQGTSLVAIRLCPLGICDL